MSDHAARMFDRALIPNQEGFHLRARVPVRQVVGWQRA